VRNLIFNKTFLVDRLNLRLDVEQPSDVGGVRKVKNFSIRGTCVLQKYESNEFRNVSIPFVLLYCKEGSSYDRVIQEGEGPGGMGSGQFSKVIDVGSTDVILAGFVQAQSEGVRMSNGLARNLNSGDDIRLYVQLYKPSEESWMCRLSLMISYSICFG
jgi:hypothetical protein